MSAPGLRTRRAVLGVYTLVLVTATHWPRLRVDMGDLPRPDLFLHLMAYGVLATLAIAAGLFGRPLHLRNLLLTWAACIAFAALDEWTQALPGLGRTPAFDDWLFNLLGVTAAVSAACLLGALPDQDTR